METSSLLSLSPIWQRSAQKMLIGFLSLPPSLAFYLTSPHFSSASTIDRNVTWSIKTKCQKNHPGKTPVVCGVWVSGVSLDSFSDFWGQWVRTDWRFIKLRGLMMWGMLGRLGNQKIWWGLEEMIASDRILASSFWAEKDKEQENECWIALRYCDGIY